MVSSLRVAAFQRHPIYDDIPKISEVLLQDMNWCEAHDVHIAVFPECYLQGYATDANTIQRRALTLDNIILSTLLKQLSQFSSTIVLGVIERRGNDFYNSALVISKGTILGVYSKAHPNEIGFKAGERFPIFNTCDWFFGINICNDANFPATAEKVAKQGIRLLCYPLNNMLKPTIAKKWCSRSIENLQTIAIQNQCWVVSSDVTGTYNGHMSYGCTLIVRPNGDIVSRAVEHQEDVAMFDLS